MAMTATKLEEIVKKRANERVQERIKQFKADMLNALNKLYGKHSAYAGHQMQDHVIIQAVYSMGGVLERLLSDTPSKGWPRRLWADEEEVVMKEILGTMDELQKALVATGEVKDAVTQAEEEAAEA